MKKNASLFLGALVIAIFSIFFLFAQNAKAACTSTANCASGQACVNGLCVASGNIPDVNSANAGSTLFTNPLRFDTVEEFVTNFLTIMQGAIVLLSLIFIIIGATLYVTSAGSEKRIESAKEAITASMIGLAIGIGAPSILKELSVILGWNSTNNDQVNNALTFTQIATNVLSFLLGVFGVLAMVMMVIGGIMYLTSAGDEDRIDTGKKIFKYSLIGTVVAMAAMVLTRQIAAFFV